MIVDALLLYQVLSKLTKPFDQWKAYKLGIIDKDGKVLKTREKLNDTEAKAFGYFDLLILNLKKLLAKVPGGSTRLGTFAAAMLLLRENAHPGTVVGSEKELLEEIRLISFLTENPPTNSALPIAGTGHLVGDKIKYSNRVLNLYKRRNAKKAKDVYQQFRMILTP